MTSKFFNTFANRATKFTGSSIAFISSVIIIVVWAVCGPFFNFSETWQLIVNTGTTIITFLMVFLIQNTQNRDNKALHLKLDELIRAKKEADDSLRGIEALSEEELEKIKNGHKITPTNT